MSDDFVEVTSKSWFEKIVDSLKAIVFGLILVIASGVAIFWNEGNSAETLAALAEGAKIVISVPADRVDIGNDGKLVHVAGQTSAAQPIKDADLGVTVDALKLARKVEMYQWKETSKSETQKKLGGGEETITRYSYMLVWSDVAINSSNFKNLSDHRNPAFPALASRTFANSSSKIGNFSLGEGVLAEISVFEKAEVPASALGTAKQKLGSNAVISQGNFFLGTDQNSPSLGDVRVSYQIVPIQPVSIIAKQVQSTFSPYVMKSGHKLLLVETGIKDPTLMFKDGKDESQLITWIVRGVAFFFMFIGFALMLSLLEVIADLIPFLGNLVGAGTMLVAFCFTLITAPVVAAIAWFYYRPLVAGAIILAGALLFLGFRSFAKKGKQGVAAPSS
jgi:Transmembrane protein 43